MFRLISQKIAFILLVLITIIFFVHMGMRMVHNSSTNEPNYDLVNVGQLAWADTRDYLTNILAGDLGVVRVNGVSEPISKVLLESYKNSMALLFIALALATPIAWRRRLVGLAVGTALVQVFVMFRIWLALTYWFGTPDTPWCMYDWRPLVWKTLLLAQEAINVAPVASFAVPALFWLMLLFRPADWSDALGALMPAQEVDNSVTDESGRSGSAE